MDLPDMPDGGGNFMEQFLADLLRMMGSGMGGANAKSDMARAMAEGVATGGEPEVNPNPLERMAIEELLQVAQLHVAEITGLDGINAPTEVQAVGPGTWAARTVEDWAFILDAAANVDVGPALAGMAEQLGDEPGPGIASFLAQAMATMGPVLAAMQLGSAVGHLARSTLGQYELPVPRPASTHSRMLVVPANLDRFASDWSLPEQDVRLWVCLRDCTVQTVLAREPVAARLRELLTAVARTTATDNAQLVGNLGDLDLGNPESLRRVFGDPETLMAAAEPSPARERAAAELAAAATAMVGYVEHVLDEAARRLLGGRGALGEAWRRQQVEREAAARSAEVLLGLDMGPATADRGAAFVNGVLERAGEAGLARLWTSGDTLPTPSEIDAPGLWLERISLHLPPGDRA